MKSFYKSIRIIILSFFTLFGATLTITAQNAWINEIHYDDANPTPPR